MEFNPMHKYAVFVLAVLVCSNLVFYVNGRQMKSVVIGNEEDRRQLNAEQVLPPSIPARPYSPGSSGRIGHSFGEDDDEDNEGMPGSSSTINGRHSQDFKRTSPGHSPGVGHAFVNNNVSEKNV
ncbi:hypothetical protein HRI_000395500 [Hibiscus trionum]|uniref:Uncharacterized protein n=1 Tax=Hibiscus trionum TaxID=183268 RepID=A0A9W7LK22_HIBTR|nr:hypothetical protein HRI_000395500 [Hibiscus trionum]